MTLARYQGYLQNNVGDTISGAAVTVKHESDQVNALVYSNDDASTSIANPLSTDGNGFLEFYAPPGFYRITASFSGGSSDLRDEPLLFPHAPSVNVSTTAYSLSEVDFGNYLRVTNTGSCGITLPNSLGHDFEEIHIRGYSSGTYTLIEDTSVTINLPTSGSLVIAPLGTVTLKRSGTSNIWDLFGVTIGA